MATVKEFVEKYNVIATDRLKEDFLNDNLHIKTYLPFVEKVTYANNLAKVTVLDSKTGNVNVKSDANYLLFCRTIIDQYTDLKVETDGFFKEYDLLNESGLLDKIMKMIPEKEINEFKMICDMKKEDTIFNMGTPKAYISQQVERVSTILGTILKPALDKIYEQLENLSDEDIENIKKTANDFLEVIK